MLFSPLERLQGRRPSPASRWEYIKRNSFKKQNALTWNASRLLANLSNLIFARKCEMLPLGDTRFAWPGNSPATQNGKRMLTNPVLTSLGTLFIRTFLKDWRSRLAYGKAEYSISLVTFFILVRPPHDIRDVWWKYLGQGTFSGCQNNAQKLFEITDYVLCLATATVSSKFKFGITKNMDLLAN